MIAHKQTTNPVFFFDETSTTIWATKRKSWTDKIYPVTLPYQNNRSKSRTILGAVGGDKHGIQFHYLVADRTNKESVIAFLTKLISETHFDASRLIVVTDNHSSHRSKLVKKWLSDNNVTMIYLPVYSSVLSPVERVWSVFKSKWAKALSKI